MKKIIAIIALALGFATAANAQFGIVGGFTSSSTSIDTKDAMANLKGVSHNQQTNAIQSQIAVSK